MDLDKPVSTFLSPSQRLASPPFVFASTYSDPMGSVLSPANCYLSLPLLIDGRVRHLTVAILFPLPPLRGFSDPARREWKFSNFREL